jgi:hypothetical protein
MEKNFPMMAFKASIRRNAMTMQPTALFKMQMHTKVESHRSCRAECCHADVICYHPNEAAEIGVGKVVSAADKVSSVVMSRLPSLWP